MGHLETILDKVKEKIGDYKESKKELDTVEDEFKSESESKFEQVLDENGEVEDWYHDVGARGGFKS